MADLVFAHRQGGEEDAYFLVAYFLVAGDGAHPGVSADGVPGFAASRLRVTQHQVFHVVFRFYAHHHFNDVSAGDDVPVFQQRATGLVAAAGDEFSGVRLRVFHGIFLHRFFFHAVVGTFHGDGISCGGDGVFQGEVAERGAGIDAAVPLFPADGDAVLAVRQVPAAHAPFVVEGEEGFLGTGNGFHRNAVIEDFRLHVFHAFPGLEEVGGQGFQAVRRILRGIPVGAVGAVVEQPFGQPGRDGFFGIALGHQFQVSRLGGYIAAVPAPPVALVGEAEPCGLQGVVLLKELGDDGHYFLEVVHAVGVQQNFRKLDLADDRQFQPVAEQVAFHLEVPDAVFRKHGINQHV